MVALVVRVLRAISVRLRPAVRGPRLVATVVPVAAVVPAVMLWVPATVAPVARLVSVVPVALAATASPRW
jgi:hypothetical protein